MKTTHLALLPFLCASQVLAYQLPTQTIKSYDCESCSQLSHETLSDHWSITNMPMKTALSNKQKSYGYRQQVTMKQLREGVTLTTTAANAVIRITPLQNQALPTLVLTTPKKDQLSLKEASSLYKEGANPEDGLTATPYQAMLQLKPELGQGTFLLKTKETNDSGTFIINVFDKYSPSYLEIESDAIQYRYGDKVTATISLKNDWLDYDIEDVNAFLLGPKKQVIPMQLKEISPNVFEAQATITSEDNALGENWYVEADVTGDVAGFFIRRNGHAGFSYSIPSATLVSVEKSTATPLTFTIQADVATASRYALQTVLYTKNNKGEMIPVQTSQNALWLEPGTRQIQFSFDKSEQLEEDNLYLGYLHLLDYGQLKTVYQFNTPIKLTDLEKAKAL